MKKPYQTPPQEIKDTLKKAIESDAELRGNKYRVDYEKTLAGWKAKVIFQPNDAFVMCECRNSEWIVASRSWLE